VATASITVLIVLVYASASPETADRRLYFHPVYLVLAAGVNAAFLTGDLFNLFVAFEMMLGASYVLLNLGGSRDQVRSGMTYVVIGLVGSALFVTAIGLTYAATGTINMAQLAERMPEISPGVASGIGFLLLVVFGIKAAIFPLFFWLPDSYPIAPSPITAVFAGLLTKVGIYAIIRTQTLIFPSDGPSPVLLTLAALTMVIGVLGAIAQADVKRLLSFHIVSQIGYMLFGVAMFSPLGVAGAVFFTANQMVVKTSLFLVSGLVEEGTGTASIKRLGGLMHRAPLWAALFGLSALSLAGLPPLSGFVAKLSLVEAGFEPGMGTGVAIVVGASLLTGLGTMFSMTKVWSGVFWGAPEVLPETVRAPKLMVGATAALVGLGVVASVAAGPLWDLSRDAGAQLIDRGSYVTAVLGEPAP